MREKVIASEGLTPLAYMLKTLRDEGQSHDDRMKAAVAAAPYVHPRLNTIQGDKDKPLTVESVVRLIVG